MQDVDGYIHSIETCGALDGPGLRYVLFLQGCPLRCLYCHNPDCLKMLDGHKMSVSEIIQDIKKYVSYIKNGGVTISGGEPFMQANFLGQLCQEIKAIGLHTAIDTSGYVEISVAAPVLQYTDLVLLDIKAIDSDLFKKITGVNINTILTFAEHLKKINKPMWVRFVLIPKLTDDLGHIERLAKFCATFPNLEKVEVLPFHKYGEYKWVELGYDYKLKDTPEPTLEQVQIAKDIFSRYGLAVQ